MSQALDTATIESINNYDSEKRFQYCVKEVVANRQIWILVDEDGCVMLNTEMKTVFLSGQTKNLPKLGRRAIGMNANQKQYH